MSERCSVHGTLCIRKPRKDNTCEECWALYRKNKENNVQDERAPRRSKEVIAAEKAEKAARKVAKQAKKAEQAALSNTEADPDGPIAEAEEVAFDPTCCEDEMEVSEATYDDILEQFNPREE